MNQTSLSIWFSQKEGAKRDSNMVAVLEFFERWTVSRGWTSCQVAAALSMSVLSVRPRLTQAVSEGLLTAIPGDVADCQYCKQKNQLYRRIII